MPDQGVLWFQNPLAKRQSATSEYAKSSRTYVVLIREDQELAGDAPRLEYVEGSQAFGHRQSIVELAVDNLCTAGTMPN